MRWCAKSLGMFSAAVAVMFLAPALLQAGYILPVDMGANGQVVADGWNELSTGTDATTAVSGVYGDVTVTVSSEVEGVGYLKARSRSAVISSNPPGDVARDFIFSDDHDLVFTLEGLAAGDYYMTTWQHDASSGGIGRLVPTVTVTDANGTNVVATDVYDTTGYEAPFGYRLLPSFSDPFLYQDEPASVTYVISSNGTDPITVVYAGGLYQGYNTPPTVSGFVVAEVPEPGIAVVLISALIAVLFYRKR